MPSTNIDAGIGSIRISTDNLALQLLAEAIKVAFERGATPQQITKAVEECKA